MTIYSTDLTALLTTMRTALAERVGPDLASGAARAELGSAIEQLDNLIGRVSWDAAVLDATNARTETLAEAVGLAAAQPQGTEGLRARRREISAVVSGAYADGAPTGEIVEAVAKFTDSDVQEQISVSMRGIFAG